MESRNIIIPVSRKAYGYSRYRELIRPYLDVFGMPYTEVDVSDLADKLCGGAALILLAQPGLFLDERAELSIISALNGGCGLVCTDPSVLRSASFSGFASFADMPVSKSGSCIAFKSKHYITEFHACGESIPLYSDLRYYCSSRLRGGDVLLTAGESPLLEVSEFSGAKIALWHDISWADTDFLGPLHGMDDVFKRCIVWAAKKPFVMKDMPPFVGMRVDDVWGAWRDVSPDNPLRWIDISNEYSFKPWLGVFPDNATDKVAGLIKAYVDSGRAVAFPHAFAGCEWVTSDLPEHWLYFDHRSQRPWSDEVMAKNAARAKAWFDEKGIRISKMALAHYYETGENALQYFIDWGCEFIGVHMPPDASYFFGSKLKCGPYRKYNQRSSFDARPVYYADYLEFPDNPKIDKKLFNCVTEIRDVRGYELAPTNDVENTIESGVTQLRRAILSSVPATLFTHESSWIQRVTPENWEREMRGFAEGIADLNPVFDTLDNICAYVKASHDITIEYARADELGNLDLSIKGTNNLDTKCHMFFEENGKITDSWRDIPKVCGVMCPCNIY